MAEEEAISRKRGQKEYLYAILNLPTSASDYEIRERHRALSVVYHPDKQRDEQTKASAVKMFYEIQRAYEILSDPFLRTVYDTLGEDGFKLKIPLSLRDLPPDELRERLARMGEEEYVQQLESRVHATGRVLCVVDATGVFRRERAAGRWYTDVGQRLWRTRVFLIGVRHSFEKEINAKTKVVVTARATQDALDDDDDDGGGGGGDTLRKAPRVLRVRGSVVGTVRHQFSPRVHIEGSADLLRRPALNLLATYASADGASTASAETRVALTGGAPPVTLTLARRLFPGALTQGSVALALAPAFAAPGVTVRLERPARAAAGVAGGWAAALSLRTFGGGPALSAAWVLAARALALQLQLGAEWTLAGAAGTVSGAWASDGGETDVVASVVLGAQGVSMRVRVTHLGQTLSLPITLATEYNAGLALAAAALPSVAFALAHYLVLGPRRRARLLARRRELRKGSDEAIAGQRRAAESCVALLRETARRHMQAERERDGLVIEEALYVPLEDEPHAALELAVDVTVPLQALVQHGQLFIPGRRSKAGLQGFYDPSPGARKQLRVRYGFRGRGHYVEVGDTAPVVLPLAEHVVDGYGGADK